MKTQRHTFFEPPAEAGTGEGEGCGGGVDRERVDRQMLHQAAAGAVPERIAGGKNGDAQGGLGLAPRKQFFKRFGKGRAPGEAFLAGKRRVGIEEGEMAGARRRSDRRFRARRERQRRAPASPSSPIPITLMRGCDDDA